MMFEILSFKNVFPHIVCESYSYCTVLSAYEKYFPVLRENLSAARGVKRGRAARPKDNCPTAEVAELHSHLI